MATYILLDPNEIVQQQQAMAAVAAAAANNNTNNNNNNNNNNFITNPMSNSSIPSKSSSSNDVSPIGKNLFHSFSCFSLHHFLLFTDRFKRLLSLPFCVYIHSSYVYLANLRIVTYT